MYPWESQELIEFKLTRNLVSKIWNHTELDLDTVSREFLISEIRKIGNLVNDAVLTIDTEMDRLTKRDCAVFNNYTCSHCEGDKIYICDPCMDEQFKNMEKIDAPK